MHPQVKYSPVTKATILACIVFLMLFPHFVPLPFYSYAIICYLLMHLMLKRLGSNLKAIGLAWEGLSAKAFIIGLSTGFAWLAFMLWIYIPLARYLSTEQSARYTEYNFLIGNLPAYLGTVVAAWIVGGIYEELAFRGFIRLGIIKVLGSSRVAFLISVVASSFLFGLYHIQQGFFGVISATLGGLYWTIIVVRSKGNLWPAIISHAIYDTAALTMIYFGIFPGQR
ncbi:CPBP family intramembrane glutamic endopeptidase [Emticicia sp. TH156]|uniref:CPBP family intramembrane glutamic endopeptidase n=1 Tax=Emticicia sp. TH156 TaxID=2067454 RepID=UPI000C788CD9|nr:CPBP family intramembrane glutamic endopeptidase [Emticicia sp. TH156]PLK44976.1 hypothetical protein C0V77_06940 [Emticicia sp. TH156]